MTNGINEREAVQLTPPLKSTTKAKPMRKAFVLAKVHAYNQTAIFGCVWRSLRAWP